MTKTAIPLEVDPSIMEKNMRIIKGNQLEEEFNKLLASVDPVPSKLVKPTPGFCVKTYTKPDNKKIFVNICLTDAIPCPRDISNEELMQILSSEDPSSYRVPMSIGEGRTEQDKSGAPTTAYDVAINPEFFKKIEKDELFQTFFLTVVFEGLQDKYQFEVEMQQKYTILKNRKSIGTLQSHRIQIRDVLGADSMTRSPLIEEINENVSKKIKLQNVKEIVCRLRREPRTGEIQFLIAEFIVPSLFEIKHIDLQVGEDRLYLNIKGAHDLFDFFLPCSIDQEGIVAQLDRNTDLLSIKMPVIH